MRVGIISLSHESNTLMPQRTEWEDFARQVVARGPEVEAHYRDSHHEVGGFFEGLKKEAIEPAGIFAARAIPSGVITKECARALVQAMFEELQKVGEVDGLLVAPHGAGVSEEWPDFDGHWLSLVREWLGKSKPMICTLDPHANLTGRMVDACDATIAYRSNPHLDQRARGLEAARLMVRTLRGEIQPVQAAAFPPMAINIERQLTSASPCKELYALADRQLSEPDVLSNSVFLGFSYADVQEMGCAFVAVADGNKELARKCAGELAGYVWTHRQEFVGVLISPEQAIDRVMASAKPVCLLDMGDNVGGGGPGDGTVLATELYKKGVNAFCCLVDPEAVAACEKAGVGGKMDFGVGGKTDPDRHGKPLAVKAQVISLHDGKFIETEARHGGNRNFNLGATALIKTDKGLTIQLISRRMMPASLNQLLAFGVDPLSFDVLVVKGVHAPVAAYAPVCPTLIRVNTPGITTADMTSLVYRHRRTPLFPFEADIDFA